MDTANETIFLREEVVLDSVADLHKTLAAQLETPEVTIDASDARFIDGAGWQVLVAFSQRHGNTKIVDAPAGVQNQAKTLGIDRLISIGAAIEKVVESTDEEDLCPVF
ncbi:MAG: STAS domain-containing protein [Pseudomonadota bacterium]